MKTALVATGIAAASACHPGKAFDCARTGYEGFLSKVSNGHVHVPEKCMDAEAREQAMAIGKTVKHFIKEGASADFSQLFTVGAEAMQLFHELKAECGFQYLKHQLKETVMNQYYDSDLDIQQLVMQRLMPHGMELYAELNNLAFGKDKQEKCENAGEFAGSSLNALFNFHINHLETSPRPMLASVEMEEARDYPDYFGKEFRHRFFKGVTYGMEKTQGDHACSQIFDELLDIEHMVHRIKHIAFNSEFTIEAVTGEFSKMLTELREADKVCNIAELHNEIKQMFHGDNMIDTLFDMQINYWTNIFTIMEDGFDFGAAMWEDRPSRAGVAVGDIVKLVLNISID